MAQERYKAEALGRVEDFEAYLVDGNAVRAELDPEFNGGSYVEHDYVPAGEVWIDASACGLGDVAEIEEELSRQVSRARGLVSTMSDEELSAALSKNYVPIV